MSVRLRLTLWYAAVLTAALALFGFLIFISLRQGLLVEIDRDLQGTGARFQTYFIAEAASEPENHLRDELEEFCQALPPSTSIHLHSSSGFVFRYPAAARLPLREARTLTRTFTYDGASFALDTAVSTAEMLHTLQLLRILLFGLTPLVILIACVGGAWLSRRALKPVHEITAAALTIGIENLSERLQVPPTRDEIARLSEVLNLMFARLESAVKTLSQFVADASHELRTPLAVIRASAEVALRRHRSPEAYRASLEEIVAESERMTQLIDDLLSIARTDTQAIEMPLTPLALKEVVRDVCEEMRSVAGLRQIAIVITYCADSSIVPGNRAALHRLLLVLLDNAIKYSRAGGSVHLTVSSNGDQVRVSIADFGVGIDARSLPHIFKRFYRADPARSGHGHGLGLSLAESIARAHGANIYVESKEGEGSRFDVVFPAAAQGVFSFPR